MYPVSRPSRSCADSGPGRDEPRVAGKGFHCGPEGSQTLFDIAQPIAQIVDALAFILDILARLATQNSDVLTQLGKLADDGRGQCDKGCPLVHERSLAGRIHG